MSGYTPAPWVWLGAPGRSVLNSAHGEVLGYASYEGMWPGAYGDDERNAANMRLIAAAPVLLEALKEIAKAEGRYSRGPLEHASNTIEDMQALAVKAIAKAEGR